MINRVTSLAQKVTEPYLLQFATPRSSESSSMEGYYCETRQLWVIDVGGIAIPIIEEATNMLAQTQTKTMAQIEADDDDQGRGAMAGTITMTEVAQEVDDQDISLMILGF